MTIPKIIHFIAPGDRSKWHPLWHRCYESWCDNHPDFEIKLWNDSDDLINLIDQYYPQYSNLYRAFPYDIMRINFSRLGILHRFGGFYSDMDVFCYYNFYDELIDNDLFILKNKLNETNSGQHKHLIHEMCLMICSENHSYFAECMENSKEQFNRLESLFSNKNIDDAWLIEQIVGGYLLLQSRDMFNPKQISLLPHTRYNNRACSYDDSFITKHMRSSLWNRSVIPDQYFIVYNLMFSVSKNDESINHLILKAESLGLEYKIIDIEDFDFYKDYSNKSYFIGDESFDSEIKKKTKEIYQYMVS